MFRTAASGARLSTSLICVGAWLGASLAGAAPAHASSHLRIQATPSKYSLTTKPGNRIVRDVVVSNSGDSPVVVRVHYSDWNIAEDGDLILLPAGSTPASLRDFVSFEPSSFSLGPGESGRIRIEMSLPANGPATRWGVLLSEVRPVDPPRGNGPRAVAELGTTIYLSRITPGSAHLDLDRMSLAEIGKDSLCVLLTVKNPGERHAYVGGEIAVKDSSGAVLRSETLPTVVVLPGRSRVLQWTYPGTLRAGHYDVTATLDTGEPELTIGEIGINWPPTAPSWTTGELSH